MKNVYLLLILGLFFILEFVCEVMFKDWCIWDDDYNLEIVEVICCKFVILVII